jgi:hypothetical protein
MQVQDKLGRFAKLAAVFAITDEAGNPRSEIVAGETVVHGPFRLVTKDQIARVTGLVTPSMVNAKHEKKPDVDVYEFQGNSWRPQGEVGDILLQDVDNPADRWACGSELFGGTGWTGTVQDDGSVTYAKPGKPLLALEIPEGTIVTSREGSRPAPAGCLLAVTKADKGDFYVWTADVVAAYVRDYPVTNYPE